MYHGNSLLHPLPYFLSPLFHILIIVIVIAIIVSEQVFLAHQRGRASTAVQLSLRMP